MSSRKIQGMSSLRYLVTNVHMWNRIPGILPGKAARQDPWILIKFYVESCPKPEYDRFRKSKNGGVLCTNVLIVAEI